MGHLSTIGFDADDTLWHSERAFRLTETRFAELLADHAEPADLSRRLLETERRNLHFYGFGWKGFVLSMIETAIEVTDRKVPTAILQQLIELGRDIARHPIEILPGVRETLHEVAERYRIVLITKGDLLDQEQKLARSDLGHLFQAVEIVTDKSAETYRRVFSRHGDGPDRGMMVGNSVRSDILPAIEAGSWAVFIPHALTWTAELADPPHEAPRFRRLERISELPRLLGEIEA
jgi:putative hydrolase of the HAD superfamily